MTDQEVTAAEMEDFETLFAQVRIPLIIVFPLDRLTAFKLTKFETRSPSYKLNFRMPPSTDKAVVLDNPGLLGGSNE